MSYDLDELMLRLAAMEREALSAVGDTVLCDAVPYWPYTQEIFPYWWNRITNLEVSQEPDLAGDVVVDTYTIDLGLVVAHLTAGYKGEMVSRVYTWIPRILDYFNLHQDLTSADPLYTDPPDYVWIVEGGSILRGIPQGLRTLANSGLGDTQQIAVVFQLEVPLLRQI